MGYLKNHLLFFLLLVVWVIFSLPFLLHQKIPYPGDHLTNASAPWNEYPQYRGPVKNEAVADVITQLYPWKYFTIEMYKSGHLPLWNPNSFSGNSHVGNYQSAIFTPLNLLFFIFSFATAWSLLILFAPLLAGVGMYFFVRYKTKDNAAGLLSAISFMFCGFITVWMEYGTLSLAIAVLPLLLLSLEKISSKRAILGVVLTTLFSFLSGHFQTSLYLFLFALSYSFFLFSQEKDKRNLSIRLGALVAGGVLSLIQIIPTLLVYKDSQRSGDFFTHVGIPFWYLITIIVPDFFGNPIKRSDWIGHFAEWAGFIGMIPFALSLVALQAWKNRFIRFFFLGGLISILFALDTPLQTLLSELHIPVLSTSYPTRIIVLFSFCFSVLAGYGMTILKLPEKKSLTKLVYPIFILFSILLIGWIGAVTGVPREKMGVAIRNLLLPSTLAVAFSIVLIVDYRFQRKQIKLILIGLLLLFTMFDSLRFAISWTPFVSRSSLYPDTKVITAIQKNLEGGRIYGSAFGNQVYSYYQIPSVEGYDPLYIGRYGEFIRASDPNGDFGLERSVIAIPPQSRRIDQLLDFLGVSLIYQPRSYVHQPWGYSPIWDDVSRFSLVFEDESVQVFKSKTAMPRAMLYCHTKVLAKETLLQTFYSKDFPYRDMLLLEEPPKKIYGEYCEERSGTAEIVESTGDTLRIKTQTDKPALLFVSDTYFPSWKAYVNGKEQTIYIADYAFRAVEIPSGEATVVMQLSLF